MAKLSRKQIREGLNTVPMDTLLLGVKTSDALTPKQREYARNVALGKTKADAYREAYNTKGKTNTVGTEVSRLSKNPSVALEIEAYREAIEAEKHRNPAQLRALVIHQLTKMALNDKVNDAQRIKSLELLGKVAEVGAFVDRKETTVINHSTDIRARLMAQLKTITAGSITEIDSDKDADSLLAEIQSAKPADDISEPSDPTGGAPAQIDPPSGDTYTHSVPLTQSTPESNVSDHSVKSSSQAVDFPQEKKCTETSYSTPQENTPHDDSKTEGVGVVKISEKGWSESGETPPVNNWNEKG
jgi:hypothetical protein